MFYSMLRVHTAMIWLPPIPQGHGKTVERVREACKQRPDKPVAILLDTKAGSDKSLSSYNCSQSENPPGPRDPNRLLQGLDQGKNGQCCRAWVSCQEELAGGKINLKEGQELKLVTDYTFKVGCCRLMSLGVIAVFDMIRIEIPNQIIALILWQGRVLFG